MRSGARMARSKGGGQGEIFAIRFGLHRRFPRVTRGVKVVAALLPKQDGYRAVAVHAFWRSGGAIKWRCWGRGNPVVRFRVHWGRSLRVARREKAVGR